MLPTLRRGRSVQVDVASPGRLVYLPEVWPHSDPRETRVQMFLSEVRGVEPGSLIYIADPGRAPMSVAIKKSSREKTVGFQELGTLRCDSCGGVRHRSSSHVGG
jgi:hypothetical protein